jgi:3-isopropylmalate dehydrogenase
MNRSVALVGGPDSQVMETAAPLLRAVGDFEFLTITPRVGDCDDYPGAVPVVNGYTETADAVLLDHLEDPTPVSTEAGAPQPGDYIRDLEKAIGANLVVQPVVAYEALHDESPLEEDRIAGTDLVLVHALGDFYGEEKGREADGTHWDRGETTREGIKEVGRKAFDLARARAEAADHSPRVTSVDKANVMETSRVWREVMVGLGQEHPGFTLRHLLVDNAAMTMVSNPAAHDVVVTNHMFGDLLAGQISALVHPAVVPSASLSPDGRGIYRAARPEGGRSAPAIALATAQALRYSLDDPEAAASVEAAVKEAFDTGVIPETLGGTATNADFTSELVWYLGGQTCH